MMAEENYLLKWNDFEKNLIDGLKALKVDNRFCDLTLVCEDSQLEAHRVVLSACSNFFRNVLTRNCHSHPLLYLKGVKMSDMESIVHFAYNGETNVALEDLEVGKIYLKSFLCNVISRFFSPVFPSRCKRPPNKGFDNPHRQLLQKK